ncbi:MAG: hypothetical protein RL338_1357 [Chloroflexota bacterium]
MQRDVPAAPPPLLHLIHAGVLDAPLGALLWVLLEGGCPFVVASPGEPGPRRQLLDALLALVGGERRRVRVADLEPGDGAGVLALAGDLGAAPYDAAAARAVAGAVSILDRGLGLSLALDADSLEGTLAAFAGGPLNVAEDRRSFLGLVVVLEPPAPPATPHGRIAVAHYLRPLSRDAGGHLQRLPPAVLAARDATTGRLEDFSWGVVPELAARIGRSAAELETEVALRARALAPG